MTTFNKQELSAKFGLVKGVIAKTSTLNHLKMLNIRVNNNEFNLTGSNGEMQVTATGECSGNDVFNVCVQPGTFSIMIGAAKNDIDISIKDNVLSTISARSKFNIPAIDGQQYPLIKLDGETKEFALRDLIESVYRASAKDQSRPFMCGTCLDVKDGEINAVATDGSLIFINKDVINMQDTSVIIPNSSAEYLAINDTDGFLLSNGSLKATSRHNNIEVICKLIDAQYPNWRRILTDYDKSFTVDRHDLLDAVSTINKADGVESLNLKSFGDVLTVSAKDTSEASINSEIEYSGDDIDYSVNPQKLLLCLNSVRSEKLTIAFDANKGLQSKIDSQLFLLAGFRK